MFILFAFYLFYKIVLKKKTSLNKRNILPKICVIINSLEYKEILRILSFQNYPKDMFDVYIFSNETFNYSYKTSKYNKDQIKESNYNLVTVLTSIVDINFLNLTSKEYLKGYDIIFGKSSCNINTYLIKRIISKITNNSIFENNFSFDIYLFNNNIINFNNITLLKKFIYSKTNLISYNFDVKSYEQNNFTKNYLSKINPLDKRKFYLKLYLFLTISFITIITNGLLYYFLFIYLILISFSMNYSLEIKHYKIIPILFIPLSMLKYFINFLRFRIDNKCSDVNSI